MNPAKQYCPRTTYVCILGRMDEKDIIDRFSALAQETRLAVFRLLVRHEPDGLPAGEIARQLAVPHNTMSAHLAVLVRAGLAVSQRKSRSIIYRAHFDHMQETLGYLVSDCCAGHPDICKPLLSSLAQCAQSQKTEGTPCDR